MIVYQGNSVKYFEFLYSFIKVGNINIISWIINKFCIYFTSILLSFTLETS